MHLNVGFWTIHFGCHLMCNVVEFSSKTSREHLHYISLSLSSYPTSFFSYILYHLFFAITPIPYSFSSGWRRRIRRAAQVGRHSSFPAQMPAGEVPYKRLSISKGSFLRHLAWRIWMTGKEFLKLVHEKSSASNKEIVLFHRGNRCGKHINSDLVLQVCVNSIKNSGIYSYQFSYLSGEETVRQINTMRANVNY